MNNPTRYGATPEDWVWWSGTLGLCKELLPTVSNPHATISPRSVLTSGAKVPSRYTTEREVVGIPRWNERHTSAFEITAWMTEPDYGICVQMRTIQAFDVDVEDPETIAAIDEVVGIYEMPRRWRGNSSKCLYLFHPQTPSKKRVLKVGDGMIEMLGLGNQCLVAGQHPSGARYQWDPFTTIPALDDRQVAELLEDLRTAVGGKKDWSRGARVPKHVLTPGVQTRVTVAKAPPTNAEHAEDAVGHDSVYPNEASPRAALEEERARAVQYAAMGPDPVVDYLTEQGVVKGEGEGGLLYVTCPFESAHGKATADRTQTCYFPAGTGGYMLGHVKCLDGSCGAYSDVDFLVGWGWTRYDQLRGFEKEDPYVAPVRVLPPLPHEEVQVVLDSLGVEVGVVPVGIQHPLEGDSALNGILSEKNGIRFGRGKILPLTPQGTADRFVILLDGRARYVFETDTWLVWKDRWVVDTGHAMLTQYAKRLKDVLKDEAIALVKMSLSQDAKTVLDWQLKVQTIQMIDSSIRFASVAPGITLPLASLNAHPYRVGVHEGRAVLDLETGLVRATAPGDYLTKSLSVAGVGQSHMARRWVQFLHEVFSGDVAMVGWIQRFCGYLLTADTREQVFLFLHGSGCNGKSVFVNILKDILGDYARTLDASTLTQSVRNAQGPSSDIAALVGRRLVLAPETEEGKSMAESLVKSLTGGDTVSTRELHCAQFEFRPQFKLVMTGNHKLAIKGTDSGIWRRMRLIPFKESFLGREDRTLEVTLQSEAPHIVAWMAEGARLWMDGGLGDVPAQVREATRAYASEMDTLGEFISDYCELGTNLHSVGPELFKFFTNWLLSCQNHPWTKKRFTTLLCERPGIGMHRTSSSRDYVGIAIRENQRTALELMSNSRN